MGRGKYADVRLVPISTDGIATGVVADRIDDLGLTGAYSLTQLQRPVTQIVAGMTERGVDTNGNGLFDLLQTTFQVDTLRAGSVHLDRNPALDRWQPRSAWRAGKARSRQA